MTTALVTTPRDPQKCFRSFLSLVGRLHSEYGLTIAYVPLGDRLGTWDGPTSTILIDQDASVEDQAWFLFQIWQLITMGPPAIDPAAVREPRLALVPALSRSALAHLA
ncbi:MAG TPA: hypothetical protein VIQ30_16265 [Pseudonocardia sp.]